METDTISIAPFPTLRWVTYAWEAEVILPSWAAFQARRGSYGLVSSAKPSDGTARLVVASTDKKQRMGPVPEQSTAFQHLLDNETAVAAAALQGLFDRYPAVREAYADDFGGDEEALPDIWEPDGLRPLIGLSNVHVLSVAKGDAAYIGFEFGCLWDSEHGAGVMTHLGRVVAVGQADTSFLAWIAKRDVGRSGNSA